MASLISREGHRKELTQSSHLVGCEAPADILVLASMGIAPQHYRLVQSSGEWEVQPLGPIGSTLVNGAPIQDRTPLRHGDQISAGQLVLALDNPEPLSSPLAAEPPKEMPVKPAANAAVAALTKPNTGTLGKRSLNKSKERKGSKAPAIALVVMVLLIGGGVAAWKSGLIDRYLPNATETVSDSEPTSLTDTSTSVPAVSEQTIGAPLTSSAEHTHFDVLSSYTPAEANVAFTFTPSQLLSAYDKWQAEFTDLPPLAGLIEAANEETGIDLSSIVRVSIAMSADTESVSGMAPQPDNAVTAVTFDSPFTMDKMVAQLRSNGTIDQIKTNQPQPVFKWTSNKPDAPNVFAFIDGTTLVASTIGHTKVPGHAPVITQLMEQMASRSSAFTAVFGLPSDLNGADLPIPEGFSLPESALLSLEFTEGFNLFAKATFSDVETASQINQQLKQTINEVGQSITESGGAGLNPLMAVLLRTKHAVKGKSVETELAFSEFEMRIILTQAASSVKALMGNATATSAKVKAQLFASLSATAIAAGSSEMDGATSAEDAVKKLLDGVKGGQDGAFADHSFKSPSMTEAEIDAALKHLTWEDRGLVYHEEPQE